MAKKKSRRRRRQQQEAPQERSEQDGRQGVLAGVHARPPDVLTEAILTGRCVLFLGSGASREADAPSWRRLLDNVAHKFCPHHLDRVERYFSRNDPWGAADLVCNEAPRPDLDVFVRDAMERLEPTEAHLCVPSLQWAAIYTTNYDTLVEDAYHQAQATRHQVPVPVYQFSTDYNIHDNSKVHVFKLHGSIDQIHQQGNVLVLTTKDLTDTHDSRAAMLSHIPRLLLDYYWLFAGYSLRDRTLRQLLTEIKRCNRDKMPRESFAVLPEITEEDRDLFVQYDISVVDSPFGAFMGSIREVVEREARGRLRTRHIDGAVVSGGVEMHFPPATRVAMDDQFEVISPVDHDYDGRGFFLGREPSWGNIEAGVDFRRDALLDRIIADIRSALAAAPTQGLVILGPAGSGKSTVLRRVGYELATARSDSVPAVIVRDAYTAGNRYAETWDARLIAEVATAAKGPVLVLIDDVEVHYRRVRNLYAELRNRDIPAVILGAARALDWSNIVSDYPMPGLAARTLPDDIDHHEVTPFVAYLERQRLISVDAVFTEDHWRQHVAGAHDHHILGIMRSLDTVGGETFDEKIVSEYFNLPELAKNAYEAICLVYQFGFHMPLDLLLLVLDCSEPEFGEEVLEKDRDHVIIRAAQTLSGRQAYKARHRVIAEIVAGQRWGETHELCKAITELFADMNVQSEEDFRLCRDLLMSDELRDRLSEITYVRRMFGSALAVFEDNNVFYQHYAKAEMEARPEPDFERAHDLLSRAVATPGSERNPTLQHSRGMLYLHQAGRTRDAGQQRSYERKAELEFTEYRRKDRGSEYGYYTHAKMLNRQRQETLASDQPDESEATRLLAKALQIVREGLEVVEKADLARLPVLEADLLKEVSPDEALRKLDEWLDTNPTPDGYYLRGLIHLRKDAFADAAGDVEQGLNIAPDHRGLLLLRVQLIRSASGYRTEDLLDATRAAMIHAPDSPRLAFEAAVAAYHLDELELAREYFRRAYAAAGRTGKPMAFLTATASEASEFHRKLAQLATKFGDTYDLSSVAAPTLAEVSGVIETMGRRMCVLRDGHGDSMFVRPDDRASWMNDGTPVVCNVAFNYMGSIAFRVRPRE